MASPAFRRSVFEKVMRAAQACGVESYDVSLDERGLPLVKVRPLAVSANDDVADEIERWRRAQEEG